jgi:hypothetical protein
MADIRGLSSDDLFHVEGMSTRVGRALRRVRPLVFALVGLSMLASQSAAIPPAAGGPRLAATRTAIADHPAGYGIAEPGNTLPRTSVPDLQGRWLDIRNQLVASGTCWLRSDMGTRLAAGIDANRWLGSQLPCSRSTRPPVKVLAILDYFTIWQGPTLCPNVRFSDVYDPQRTGNFSLSDWTLLVRCVARRFAGRIAAYEIWNEPLLRPFQYGYQDGSAGHYFEMLRIAHREIKAADPRALVIALGGSDLYANRDHAERLVRAKTFTRELVHLGAANYADAISVHAYPWGTYGPTVWASYRSELAFHARAWGKPVWITETGHRANENGTQSEYLREAYALFLEADVERIFWFAMTDQKDGPFGIAGKPAQQALRAFIGAPKGTGPVSARPR